MFDVRRCYIDTDRAGRDVQAAVAVAAVLHQLLVVGACVYALLFVIVVSPVNTSIITIG